MYTDVFWPSVLVSSRGSDGRETISENDSINFLFSRCWEHYTVHSVIKGKWCMRSQFDLNGDVCVDFHDWDHHIVSQPPLCLEKSVHLSKCFEKQNGVKANSNNTRNLTKHKNSHSRVYWNWYLVLCLVLTSTDIQGQTVIDNRNKQTSRTEGRNLQNYTATTCAPWNQNIH